MSIIIHTTVSTVFTVWNTSVRHKEKNKKNNFQVVQRKTITNYINV